MLLAMGLFACSTAASSGITTKNPNAKPISSSPQRQARPASGVQSAQVKAGSYGPYRVVRERDALLLWAAPHAEGRLWYAQITDAEGVPNGNPVELFSAPDEVGLVTLKSLPQGGGFMVLVSYVADDGQKLSTFVLGNDARVIHRDAVVAEPEALLSWIELVETPTRLVAFWAAKTLSGYANLYALPLSSQGEAFGAPRQVATAALAWQVAAVDEGIALSTVIPEQRTSRGKVWLTRLDAQAVIKTKLVVSDLATAQGDLDMGRVGEQLLLAWSDVRAQEPRIFGAVVSSTGAQLLQAPRALVPSMREQSLIRIVSATSGLAHSFLAWEEAREGEQGLTLGSAEALGRRLPGAREIHLLRVDAALAAQGERASFAYFGDYGSVPELVASEAGLTVLTKAQLCVDDENCDTVPVATFAAFDTALHVLAAEPLRVPDKDEPHVNYAWGLDCTGEECTALATHSLDPAPIYTSRLRRTASEPSVHVAWTEPKPEPPFVVSSELLAETEPLSAIVSAQLTDRTLVSWLTYFDPNTPANGPKRPAPDGKMAPVQALLQLRSIAADGSLGATETVSYRARSLGGIDAAANSAASEALLVWSALDQGKPHVFLTLVDANGKKRAQKMLTPVGAEVYDVAATFVGDGYIVGFIDTRSGQPRAYVTKVDAKLNRKSPDRQIGLKECGNIALATASGKVAVVTSEARDRVDADGIFYTTLNPLDGSQLAEQQRLSKGEMHAHSPQLGVSGERVFVTWLEEIPNTPNEAATLVVAEVGVSTGISSSQSLTAAAEQVLARATGLDCSATSCRLALIARNQDQLELFALRWSSSGAGLEARRNSTELYAKPVAEVGPGSVVVAPSLDQGRIYLADSNRFGRGRLRALTVTW